MDVCPSPGWLSTNPIQFHSMSIELLFLRLRIRMSLFGIESSHSWQQHEQNDQESVCTPLKLELDLFADWPPEPARTYRDIIAEAASAATPQNGIDPAAKAFIPLGSCRGVSRFSCPR